MKVEFNSDSVRFATLAEGEPFMWCGEAYLRMNTLTVEDGKEYNAIHFFSGMTVYIADDAIVTPVDAKVVVERGNA